MPRRCRAQACQTGPGLPAVRSGLLSRRTHGLSGLALGLLVGRDRPLRLVRLGLLGFLVPSQLTLCHVILPSPRRAGRGGLYWSLRRDRQGRSFPNARPFHNLSNRLPTPTPSCFALLTVTPHSRAARASSPRSR